MALNKCLPFEFRKWGLNAHYGSYGCNSCEAGSPDDASQELPFTTLIHYAAQIGHVPLLRVFRNEGEVEAGLQAYLLHESPHGLLLDACLHEQIGVLEHLLRFYAECIDCNMFKQALHGATFGRHEKALCTLLPHASAFGTNLSDAIPIAIYRGNTACAERLLEAGATFNPWIPSHNKALDAAIAGDLDSIIAMLISSHQLAAVDVCNPDFLDRGGLGSRGLMFAAERGLTLTLKAMLEIGTAIDGIDDTGSVALHYAANAGHIKAVRLLLENNCNVNAYSSTEETSLHLASKRGHTDVVQMLCEHGASVNARAKVLFITALHVAAKYGHRDIIRILHEHGADINFLDIQGLTPPSYAIESEEKYAETLLRELGGIQGQYDSVPFVQPKQYDLDNASQECLSGA